MRAVVAERQRDRRARADAAQAGQPRRERRRAARPIWRCEIGELRRRERLHVGRSSRLRRAAACAATAACGFSTTSSLRSCSPSLSSTVTMFDWTMAGSLAQPSTLTVLAANGPPRCSGVAARHDELGELDDHRDAPRRARRRIGQRLQVQRAQQVAVDQLERRARLAHQRQRRGLLARAPSGASRPSRRRRASPARRGCGRSGARRRRSRT